MHLIINTLSITADGGGIKTYLTNIISRLALLKKETRLTLICSKSSYPVFREWEGYERIEIRKLPVSSKKNYIRIFLDQILIPLFLFVFYRTSEGILITPSSIATVFCPLKQITIIQAAMTLKNIRESLPEEFVKDFSLFQKIYYDIFLPLTLKRSEYVIAVSEYLKDRLLEVNSEVRKKVGVVYEGVELENFKRVYKEQLSDAKTFEILFVSTLYGYKNADKLIKAFKKLNSKKSVGGDLRLTIVGNDPSGGDRMAELKSLTAQLGIEEIVDFAGYIPHREIQIFYEKASLFVFPSAVETFGLPPLEAMACGIPVIGSDRMSVPEIIGDAGIIIDPDNVDSIADAMFKILENKDFRQELIFRGNHRVKEFQWSVAAKKILQIANDLEHGKNS